MVNKLLVRNDQTRSDVPANKKCEKNTLRRGHKIESLRDNKPEVCLPGGSANNLNRSGKSDKTHTHMGFPTYILDTIYGSLHGVHESTGINRWIHMDHHGYDDTRGVHK